MPRKLTPATTLDNLRRKEAKRWLKALRENDVQARERFLGAYPMGSDDPILRDVQHALAREYGLESWKELRFAVQKTSAEHGAEQDIQTEPTVRFLEFACPDHHVRGRSTHRMASQAAIRFLEQNPGITRQDLYTSVVCGEI